MIVSQDYRAGTLIGICTTIVVDAFKLLFSKSIFEVFSEIIMPSMIFDKISCHFKVLCSGKGGLSPVGQNQSPFLLVNRSMELREFTKLHSID